MKLSDTVIPTPAQEQAAFAWLSLLHDRPSAGDQLTFSQWLRADPAHAEAYAQRHFFRRRGPGERKRHHQGGRKTDDDDRCPGPEPSHALISFAGAS